MKRPMRWMRPRALLVGCAVFWIAGCVTAPETGRRQLVLIGSAQEMQLGLQAFSDMKKETPVSKNAAAMALVEKVGRRIAAVADLPGAEWEFVLFESPEANAFCLPGGKVGVYTGILPITKDEAGLATVIAHEVAHAAAHHGAERMSRAIITQGLGEVASAYVGGKDPRYQAAFGSLYGIGVQVGETLPHSRKQESEADQIGLIYMAKAGYDPEAAVAFWERFAEYNRRQGSQTPAFLRTHPLDERRIADLKQWMPQAKAAYRPAR
ncbi:MAG: M48 family metallopeptidase [Verrucomicrobia bacterium]|nr:M48 family metallopeptidase [Verrucomicrobiota bacterium]NMD21071.1 M48 family metallopeptidase [Verrucomicrobiota bacterium]HNU98370.1 M48 family metallopeptidase [Verrucomicrobiota bacterium]HOA60847.1 M48 family metallopeptidase [Verrucomicrobiota bacterium]HOF48496.1 M48 family metallopeptidase [Verrucomicrobiota bacterium]